MTYTDAAIKNDKADEWAERGDYWLQQVNPALSYNDRKRRHLHLPLILSGHGVRLKVDRGTLLIQCGYTHYPQKPESYRYFPRDICKPPHLWASLLLTLILGNRLLLMGILSHFIITTESKRRV